MANNTIQIKRTSVSGRTPNTTNSANSQYINTGELALNLTDKKLFSSDGTNPAFEIGSNLNSIAVSTGFIANSTRITLTGLPLSANGSVGTQGQVLASNGSIGSPYWATVTGGSGSPAGSTTQVQYNNAGAFAASGGFTFDYVTANLNLSVTNATGTYITSITPTDYTYSYDEGSGFSETLGFGIKGDTKFGLTSFTNNYFSVADGGVNKTIMGVGGVIGRSSTTNTFVLSPTLVRNGSGSASNFTLLNASGGTSISSNVCCIISKTSGVLGEPRGVLTLRPASIKLQDETISDVFTVNTTAISHTGQASFGTFSVSSLTIGTGPTTSIYDYAIILSDYSLPSTMKLSASSIIFDESTEQETTQTTAFTYGKLNAAIAASAFL